ncbi:hypothetical protein D3C73_1261060 [compost metagenome]
MCAFAICLFISPGVNPLTTSPNMVIKGMNIKVPKVLNIKCISAALRAVLLVPIQANKAVTHVPILHPNSTGIANFISIAPVVAKAISIPVVAEELCTIPVIIKPANMPIYHL